MRFKNWLENTYTLYHGSNSSSEFKSFNLVGDENKWGPGAYFAFRREDAMGWGNKVYQVELKVDKPFRSDRFMTPELFDEIVSAALRLGMVPPPKDFRNDKNGYVIYQLITKLNGHSKKNTNEILRAAGFDAIIDVDREIIALDKNKIRII